MRPGSLKLLAIDGNPEVLAAVTSAVLDALPAAILQTAAIFAKDRDGRYQAINEAGARKLGHPAAEVIGKTDRELLPAAAADESRTTDELVQATGQPSEREERGLVDGSARTYLTRKTPWRDQGGNVVGVIGVSNDITEHRRRESLREARTRLMLFADSHPVDALLEECLNEVERLTGSLIGFFHFVDPDQTTLSLQSWSTMTKKVFCTAAGKGMHCEVAKAGVWVDCVHQRKPVIHNDYASLPHRKGLPPGHALLVRELVVPVMRGGRITAVLGVGNKPGDYDGQDITIVSECADLAWDLAERKLAVTQLQYQANLLAHVSDAIVATDRRFTIQYWNAAAEKQYGWTAAEVLGKHLVEVIQTRFTGDSRREVMRKVGREGYWSGELVQNRRDGSLFPVQATLSEVRDVEGRLVGHVAINRDITENLRSAEERVKLEDQLRQAQKVEAIGRLAGGVAHDFNNLTAIILGYGEMLQERLRQEDPALKWMEQIMEAGRRSAALTRQLLAFSRKQTLLPEVLDLNALLRNLEKMLGRLIGEDIQLQFRLAADLGRIKADPGQIEQVVTNLVLNARDAMPRGGRLTVETADVELDAAYARDHEGAIPGEYVRLALTDTGCGMDEAALARLFEPFYTTKERGKGTGLGLPTVLGIVKQSGGYIWVSSEPGRGSTFEIYLPRTDAAARAKAIEAGGDAPRGSGEQILLVEDETSLRNLCEAILSRLGYRVSVAGSGPEALLLLEERQLEPDLVITDVIMPGMSGAELAERLRGKRPELKVIFMSGYPDDAIAPHGVLDSGTPFIQKPFAERALAKKVRQVLGRKAAAAPPGGCVLMIDDDEQYRELVRHFCTKRGHDFTGVDAAGAALEALAGRRFDVLLVDLNIPGTSGEQILREIRAAGHATPAIVLTGDVTAADLDALRPLGVVRALEKSSRAEPLLKAIDEAGMPSGSPRAAGAP
jgi:PAS domain S-box-containing protein